jgi:hypothetical protein
LEVVLTTEMGPEVSLKVSLQRTDLRSKRLHHVI